MLAPKPPVLSPPVVAAGAAPEAGTADAPKVLADAEPKPNPPPKALPLAMLRPACTSCVRMCFNSSPERRVPSPNRYMAVASFCFCKNNKRSIIIMCVCVCVFVCVCVCVCGAETRRCPALLARGGGLVLCRVSI